MADITESSSPRYSVWFWNEVYKALWAVAHSLRRRDPPMKARSIYLQSLMGVIRAIERSGRILPSQVRRDMDQSPAPPPTDDDTPTHGDTPESTSPS